MGDKLIIGCGYLGGRVARRWLDQGQTVCGVTRSSQRAAELQQEGIRAIVADITRPETLRDLPPAETVLYSIGYDRRGGDSRQAIQVDGLRAVLDALPHGVQRLIYISSTGVYGRCDGTWIDEDTPCRPTRDAGRAPLAAERVLADHPLLANAITLRLAGLYGPGRIPRIADLVAGRPLAIPASGYLNLIHVVDAASVVLAADRIAVPPRTYLVSDGHPTTRRDFYQRLAELLGAPHPRVFEPVPGDEAQPRSVANKRISNARMLAELGVKLAYPSFREGLAAVVSAVSPHANG